MFMSFQFFVDGEPRQVLFIGFKTEEDVRAEISKRFPHVGGIILLLPGDPDGVVIGPTAGNATWVSRSQHSIDLTPEMVQDILAAESCCDGEGQRGNPANLLRFIQVAMPEAIGGYEWLYRHNNY